MAIIIVLQFRKKIIVRQHFKKYFPFKGDEKVYTVCTQQFEIIDWLFKYIYKINKMKWNKSHVCCGVVYNLMYTLESIYTKFKKSHHRLSLNYSHKSRFVSLTEFGLNHDDETITKHDTHKTFYIFSMVHIYEEKNW